MSREVQLQADVGSLSLQGLGAFTSILATLSTDNIVPRALIQMEKLGATLPTSGNYAESVKDLLRRCNDVRLDHLAPVIGWRENDTASLMAESAGGQAIALLSMCLTSLFKHSDTGTIFARLCFKLCSRSANVSSVSQLADVARLLAGKVDALGFGNLLAQEVTRVHSAYEALGHTSVPAKLLERLSIEFVTEMLEKISHGLCQDHKICRISGSRGMGHVFGLVQALFPRATVLTVEGVVIQDVARPKIRCEILHGDADGLTRIQLETSLSHTLPIKWPIKPVNPMSNPVYQDTPYSFVWSKWLADYLRLTFMNYGLRCDLSILEACCNLLVHIPASLNIGTTVSSSKTDRTRNIPTTPLLALLGPLPQARMCSICGNLLGCSPTEDHTDIRKAFTQLVAAVSYIVRGLTCGCTQDRCEWSLGWGFDNAKALEPRKRCHRFQ